MPFLVGLACAANIGSAATLIGNPQNMLIGQTLNLSFGRYLLLTFIPVALSLIVTWCIIIVLKRRQGWVSGESAMAIPDDKRSEGPALLDLWQTTKGLAVAIVLFIAFMYAPWPRELMALAGAGLLL